MRPQDVEIGETYQVRVPQRLPAALRDRIPRTAEAFAADMQLHLHRGRRFPLTVTFLEADATITGIQATHTSNAQLPLTDEQAALLGLAAGHTYQIRGTITDDEGQPVPLPAAVTYSGIPARWLRPLDELTYLDDRSEAFYRALTRREANGKTQEEVAQAVQEEHERARRLAGLMLDDLNAEPSLRSSEVQHEEWRRIAQLMESEGATTYARSRDAFGLEDDKKCPWKIPT